MINAMYFMCCAIFWLSSLALILKWAITPLTWISINDRKIMPVDSGKSFEVGYKLSIAILLSVIAIMLMKTGAFQ